MAADQKFDTLAFLEGGAVGVEAVGATPGSALSGHAGDERLARTFRLMQRGLVYPAPYARFVTVWEAQDARITRAHVSELAKKTLDFIEKDYAGTRTTMVVGVGFPLYQRWCDDDGGSVPAGMEYSRPVEDGGDSDVFPRSHGVFQNSQGSLWFHIKSDHEPNLAAVGEFILSELGDLIDRERTVCQDCSSRTTDKAPEGKVLGCRFSENLNNPADPVTVSRHTLVGYEDVEHAGASYVLAQRFAINWEQLHNMTEEQIEDLIGRTTDDVILPSQDTRTHINSARQRDADGNTMFVMRLGLPYGQAVEKRELAVRGANLRDEKGIYFAGFARSVEVFETIMDRQIGDHDGFMNDRLFNNVRSNLGGFFYIPNRIDLGLEPVDWEGEKNERWGGFPGVDWSRLSRHFNDRSKNGVMFYSHKNYLYEMSTGGRGGTAKDGTEIPPYPYEKLPSTRILGLLLDMFTRWQDAWYFSKGQPPMGHLCQHLAMDPAFGPKTAEDVMGLSLIERKAWAIRMTCRLYTDRDYGYRGWRWHPEGSVPTHEPNYGYEEKADKPAEPPTQEAGEPRTKCPREASEEERKSEDWYEGADSFRIHPWELIVGALPDLSLAQGRFCIKYLTPEEEQPNYFTGLSEASGVGHIIPDHQKLVEKGIGELMKEIRELEAKVDARTDLKKKREDGNEAKAKEDEAKEKQKRKEFYRACLISLQGVQDHLERYAELAAEDAAKLGPAQNAERENLNAIAARCKKLVTEKPDTMLEAAQLIFTMHSCLQLNGEAVAIGRLDQYLQPLYEAEAGLSEDEAQEIIDAFWIKLSEKVLINRMFIQDEQPYGNLAMGGGSAPYPQGASLGQWIQQITVGGVVASDDPKEKLAYNAVTKMCIRASGRLPLNAPCLSLRTHKDMPKDYLDEAAQAILSGGAHPVLMNDEKIVAGLKACGDDMGGEELRKGEFKDLWKSEISLKSARNYASDGCYEPMFVGENWFTLGGFSSLNPLECALNKGRLYGAAGPAYLRGKNESFHSKAAKDIESFEELLEIYFKHFYLLIAKSLNGQINGYDALVKVCPTPLLSTLMDDCLAKGLDFYGGGAKYNVFGPCFIGLSSTINSLYAIKKMVFDPDSAVTSLPELVDCLLCDWGHNPVEPMVSSMIGSTRVQGKTERWKRLREIALEYPRYGRGHEEIDQLGDRIIEGIADRTVRVFREPAESTYKTMKRFAKAYGTKEHPFGGLQVQPGVGTFENFVAFGGWSGASADGRRNGDPIASDLSPAPSRADRDPDPQKVSFSRSLAGYTGRGTDKIWDGAPTDFNIEEDFPKKDLVRVLGEFAAGQGSNLLTITCADPATLQDAPDKPERYDVLRVRMGGWTEFFTSMFPKSQQQHLRRPISTPEAD